MKILLGVIQQKNSEYLFILEDGNCTIVRANEAIVLPFENYALLKNRSFKIQEEPVGGSGVFRFRYGPVTSGIREAGCFYLYTYGEKILRASIDLSWKHRGIESAMENKDFHTGTTLAERVCSNFAMAHSVAYCRAVEQALGISVNLQTKNWRIMLLEAERIYNHLHVIYKLAAAAAQKVLAAHLSALFENTLWLNEFLTGSRYLIGINQVGVFDYTPELKAMESAVKGYQQLAAKFTELYTHSLSNSNYLDRLHASGMLTSLQAQRFGLTGPSLRACGIDDKLNGSGIKHLSDLPVITQNEGDALARMEVRSEEIVNSCQFLAVHLQENDTWKEGTIAIPNLENTSGEGCGVANSASGAIGYHVVIEKGNLKEVNIFTPSYVGMHAISTALQDLVFTDFPFVFDSFGVHFTDASR
jgi:Ni,Fe-hydrogenase III large subunit